MDFETLAVALLGLNLAGVILLTAAVLRLELPRRRRAGQYEDARRAVWAAEQLGGRGVDKATTATRFLLEVHPKLSPHRARMLVEAAVAESKK